MVSYAVGKNEAPNSKTIIAWQVFGHFWSIFRQKTCSFFQETTPPSPQTDTKSKLSGANFTKIYPLDFRQNPKTCSRVVKNWSILARFCLSSQNLARIDQFLTTLEQVLRFFPKSSGEILTYFWPKMDQKVPQFLAPKMAKKDSKQSHFWSKMNHFLPDCQIAKMAHFLAKNSFDWSLFWLFLALKFDD